MASITPLASGRGLPDLSVVEFAIMIALLRLGPKPAPLLLGTLSEWFGQDVTLSDIQPGVRRLVHQHFLRLEAGGTLRPQARSVSPVATSFSAMIRIVGTEFRRALDRSEAPILDLILKQVAEDRRREEEAGKHGTSHKELDKD